jgi:hypothetical protein
MTTTTVQTLVAAAQRLSPTEQFEIIQALTRVLQQRYVQQETFPVGSNDANAVPPGIRRSSPVKSLADFAGDFWPEDESADDINTFVAQQRAADRLRDVPGGDL